MKTFKNQMTEATKGDEPQDFVGLLRMCLDCPPDGGFMFEDLRKRSRIDNKYLESNNGSIKTIEFEDADADYVKVVVHQMRWGARHPDLLLFLDAIEAL